LLIRVSANELGWRTALSEGPRRHGHDYERLAAAGPAISSRANGRRLLNAREPVRKAEDLARNAYGDFRRLHRMGVIACHYRAAEWGHKDIELAAHDLLQYLDNSRA
jgi:hypothetical protein